MSTQNPNDQTPNDDVSASDDVDQSDALKRAILKLQQSGMLTHVPDDFQSIKENQSQAKSASDDQPPATTDDAKQEISQSDDPTISSRPKAESPTIASTADVERHAEERAKWSAVMSGWDDASVASETPTPPTIPSRDTAQEASANDDDWSLPQKTTSQPDPPVEDESAITLRRKEIKPQREESALTSSRDETPWTLQQFFDGEIDLEQELLKRFPTVPAMTGIKFRTLGMNSSRKVATLAAQDGAAQIIFDADMSTKVVQISFTYGSMITLRYVLSDIPGNNRDRWLDLMRRDKGGLAFLWNENRFHDDYLICISREYSTNVFAFSPRNFESAVRITKPVTDKLLDWLEEIWTSEPEPDDDDESPLLTW